MELKPGYKQTEVGVIPEEWDVEPCWRVSKVITVGIVVKPTQYYEKHGVPALRSATSVRIESTGLISFSSPKNPMPSLQRAKCNTATFSQFALGIPEQVPQFLEPLQAQIASTS